MLLLNNKDVKKVLFDPPRCKENEIYLKELNRSETEKPCGIITENGKRICILRQNNFLFIQDMSTLEIIHQTSTETLQGAIEYVRETQGLKDVLLFKDSKELKKWST